jgi:hypothetical protein
MIRICSIILSYIGFIFLMIANIICKLDIKYWSNISNRIYKIAIPEYYYLDDNIIIIKQFMNHHLLNYIKKEFQKSENNYYDSNKAFAPNSLHMSHSYLELLVYAYQPIFEKILNKKLQPQYGNCKLYKNNSILLPHKDFPELEYTVSINVSEADYQTLMIFDKLLFKIELNVGDALLFNGHKLLHMRSKYEGNTFMQILFHYKSIC